MTLPLRGWIIAFPSQTGEGPLVTMWYPDEASARKTLAAYGWREAVVIEATKAMEVLRVFAQ